MKVNELKAELARKELTIGEFAELTKIARTTIWKRFKGRGEFNLSEIKRISTILGLDNNRILEIFFDEKVS